MKTLTNQLISKQLIYWKVTDIVTFDYGQGVWEKWAFELDLWYVGQNNLTPKKSCPKISL